MDKWMVVWLVKLIDVELNKPVKSSIFGLNCKIDEIQIIFKVSFFNLFEIKIRKGVIFQICENKIFDSQMMDSSFFIIFEFLNVNADINCEVRVSSHSILAL
jgi:hypothetical protein